MQKAAILNTCHFIRKFMQMEEDEVDSPNGHHTLHLLGLGPMTTRSIYDFNVQIPYIFSMFSNCVSTLYKLT